MTVIGTEIHASAPADRSRPPTLALTACVAVVAAGMFMLIRDSLVDDAYITLGYVRNFAFHLHWGLVPGHTANTATSPLNVLVQGALTAILRRPMFGLGALYILSHATVAYALPRIASRLSLPMWSALLGSALVLFSPLLNSAVGLEVALSGAVLAVLAMAAVEARPVLFGAFAGLLAMTRVDLLIFAVVLFAGFPGLRHTWWKILLTAIGTSLPWFAWSWVVLGSAVPDTLLIKASMSASQSRWAFAEGPRNMYDGFPVMTLLSFLPALLGIAAIAAWLVVGLRKGLTRAGFTPVVLLGLGGVLHYGAYSLLNAPLFHWYYSYGITALTFLLALSVGALAKLCRPLLDRRRVGAVSGIIVLLLAASQVAYDAHHGLPWIQGAYNGNAALPAEYATIGLAIKQKVGHRAVQSPGEIGTIAYFCECEILDELSDRGIAVSILKQQEQQRGLLVRTLLDLNFHFLDKNLEPAPTDYAITYSKNRPTGVPYWPVTGPSWIGNGYDALVAR